MNKRAARRGGAAAILAVTAGAAYLSPTRGGEKTAARPPVLIALRHSDSLWLVGAYDTRRGWLGDEKARPLFREGARFLLLGAGGTAGHSTAGRLESGEEAGGFYAKVAGGRRATKTPLVALSGATRPLPRPVKAQSLANPAYREAAAAALRQAGLKAKNSRLTQHLRVDLDGDGTEEVLLCAHSRDSLGRTTQTQPGDYALAALRHVSGEGVQTVPLKRDVYVKTWPHGAMSYRYTVLACPDINGDGRMEIALFTQYHEGDSIDIFTFDGRTVRRVLTTGWGV